MALSLTFQDLKSAILNKASEYDTCEAYWEAMVTKDHQELINVCIPYMEYLIRTNSLTDDLLSEFDEAVILNPNGIYTTNATVTNPNVEIFVLKSAAVDIELNNAWRHNVVIMGNAVANITVSNNTFVKVKTWKNSSVQIVVNDTSAACIETKQSSQVQLNASGTASIQATITGDSIFTANADENSRLNVQGFGHSIINVLGTGRIIQRLYDLSKNQIFN